MLTSNIIKHFRHQNWGAAFIDFIVVVLGIFVAIQVNSWNEERANSKKERIILEQLYSEVSKNIDHIQSLVKVHKDKAAGLDYVIKELAADTIEPNAENAIDPIVEMFQLPPIQVSMGTYDSLVATGDIALIQDPQLKALLFSLDAVVKGEKSFVDYFRQLNISDRDYARGLVTLTPNMDNTGTTIHVDFERIREDKNLFILVANSKHTHLLFSRIRENVAKEFEKVKTYISNMPEKTNL